MMRLRSRRTLGIIAALLLLADCGQSQGTLSLPAGPPALAQRVPRENGEVQYFSSFGNGSLSEFDYPKSESQIGQITGVNEAQGECTKGARTFWVVASGAVDVEEFKAGGTTPIATRSVTAGAPAGCAIDPTTGDLAVTIISNGDVVLFKPGSSAGSALPSGLVEAFLDGYDARGNLFVDGFNSSAAFQLVELPKGSSTFENISGVSPDGNIQWDGNYLTIGCGGEICRYRIVGTKAILKGIVPVSGCAAYWIARPYVYCADAGNNDGEVFKYPVGGSPIATLGGSFDEPLDVVSLRVR
jgi:hypothetical protein